MMQPESAPSATESADQGAALPEGTDTRQARKQARHDANLRARVQEAEAERDTLRGRVDALVSAEVARLLGQQVSDVALALTVGGKTPADFLAEDATVSTEAVKTFAEGVLKAHPALRRGLPAATADAQHRVQRDQVPATNTGPGWAEILRRT